MGTVQVTATQPIAHTTVFDAFCDGTPPSGHVDVTGAVNSYNDAANELAIECTFETWLDDRIQKLCIAIHENLS
jgi:hypothetical protein